MTTDDIKEFLRKLFTGEWLGTSDLARISTIIFWAIVIGCVAALFGIEPLLWAFAALMAGMLLGFLFGIPRVRQASPGANASDDADAAAELRGNGYSQRVNTNLEEISDWLTKIIVGVGLVELTQVPEAFESLVMFLTPEDGSPGTTGTILVLFSIIGFFDGYLLTRIYLAAAFSRADQLANSFDRKLAELRQKIQEDFPEPATAEPEELDEDLSTEFPRGAVIQAWQHVEDSALESLKKKSIEPDRVKVKVLDQLRENNILSAKQLDSLRRLRELRNIAVHDSNNRISSRDAKEFAHVATNIAAQLKK